MIPESHQSKDIRIYKCTKFPLKWKLHGILMKNVSAVFTDNKNNKILITSDFASFNSSGKMIRQTCMQ